MKKTLLILSLLTTAPAMAQTMYKCPNAAGTVNFQQMPCTLQGGGEAVAKKEIKSTGSSSISESAKSYLSGVESQRAEQARVDAEESKRREALNVERNKAAAQRETAEAIDRQTAVMAAPRVITIRHK